MNYNKILFALFVAATAPSTFAGENLTCSSLQSVKLRYDGESLNLKVGETVRSRYWGTNKKVYTVSRLSSGGYVTGSASRLNDDSDFNEFFKAECITTDGRIIAKHAKDWPGDFSWGGLIVVSPGVFFQRVTYASGSNSERLNASILRQVLAALAAN